VNKLYTDHWRRRDHPRCLYRLHSFAIQYSLTSSHDNLVIQHDVTTNLQQLGWPTTCWELNSTTQTCRAIYSLVARPCQDVGMWQNMLYIMFVGGINLCTTCPWAMFYTNSGCRVWPRSLPSIGVHLFRQAAGSVLPASVNPASIPRTTRTQHIVAYGNNPIDNTTLYLRPRSFKF